MAQRADDERVRPEVVVSLDLFADLALGPGRLSLYAEGNSTPRSGGVSSLIGEANTDAGTALGSQGTGRLQLSEAKYVVGWGRGVSLGVGLLDATGYLDVSRIANDENLHFLGVPFVNNPTIEFPDYALGVAMERPPPDGTGVGLGAVVTSSAGLADNPGVSYAQLLDVRERGKGIFAGGAVRWRAPDWRASLGAWAHTADHESLDGSGGTASNYGSFAVAGRWWDEHSVSARVGVANPDVHRAAAFGGITYLWSRGPAAVGLAGGHSRASNRAASPGVGNVSHFELFYRFDGPGDTRITTSVQRVLNSGFDATDATRAPDLRVLGVRVTRAF